MFEKARRGFSRSAIPLSAKAHSAQPASGAAKKQKPGKTEAGSARKREHGR